MAPSRAIRKPNLTNIILLGSLLLLTVTALPWYALYVGISPAEWWLFLSFVLATGFSITVGYHRLFAHRSFQASPLIAFLALFFGAGALEQSALTWSSQHRDHHRYVDTERDPYNIKQGFWYAHIGWMLVQHERPTTANVKDLLTDPLIRHQHRYYVLWAIVAGVLLPLVIGALTGHLLGAFLFGVVGRLTFVHHSTWSINSICHTFGRATYDIDATARDHWLVALITNGEGYHNFHHRFASDYRNGVRWYQWDPSKWVIAFLSGCGLAKKLYRTSPHAILAAQLAAEQLRVERALATRTEAHIGDFVEMLRERYASVKHSLYEWERWEKESRRIGDTMKLRSRGYLDVIRLSAKEHRRTFERARQRWAGLINQNPLIPRAVHV